LLYTRHINFDPKSVTFNLLKYSRKYGVARESTGDLLTLVTWI